MLREAPLLKTLVLNLAPRFWKYAPYPSFWPIDSSRIFSQVPHRRYRVPRGDSTFGADPRAQVFQLNRALAFIAFIAAQRREA